MPWHPFNGGRTLGTIGTESGVILRDDEHERGARITLEQNAKAAPYSITCEIYEWFSQTHYVDDLVESRTQYDAMETAIENILGLIPLEPDPGADAVVMDAVSSFFAEFS